MFSQSGNDSKCFFKKSFFRICMWNSRDPPPFMEKSILDFNFDYLNPSLRCCCWWVANVFLAFNVLIWTEQMAEYKNFQTKRRNSPQKTICLFCTILTTMFCCVIRRLFTSFRSNGTQKWQWAPLQWLGMTFYECGGPLGAQIA